MRSKKLLQKAKGRPCLVRLPGCTVDAATVVCAHKNSSGGIALKSNDLFTAHACFSCHNKIDGIRRKDPELLVSMYEGILRTIDVLMEEGEIEVLVK